jgi:hypothetical protein
MPSAAHQSASQVPGEQTFGGDHHLGSIGGNALQQGIGAGLHRAVQENFAALVKDTDLPGPGVQGDAAVIVMRLGVEAPEVSSAVASVSPTPTDHRGLPRRGPP